VTVERYLADLGAALHEVGIGGALRRRILVEAEDHLTSDPEALVRFGAPTELARLFADELATERSRRAAFLSFAALAVAGVFFGSAWLLGPAAGSPDILSAEVPALGVIAGVGMLLCPQIALVAGALALLRATRLRHDRIAPAAELALLLRRSRIALLFGVLSLASLALYAVEFRAQLAGWYAFGASLGAFASAFPLALAAHAASGAARIRSRAAGGAGDVFDDLPLPLPRRPWALCIGTALVVGLGALLAGGSDEGPRNAVVEALAVVGGFAVLGRRLGLRRD
jgi:hypothetical protein